MDRAQFNNLGVGDEIRNVATGTVYTVTEYHRATEGPFEQRYTYTAAVFTDVTNPDEWEKVQPVEAAKTP